MVVPGRSHCWQARALPWRDEPDAPGDLLARPRRVGAAVAPLADRGELGGLPASPAAPDRPAARHRRRARAPSPPTSPPGCPPDRWPGSTTRRPPWPTTRRLAADRGLRNLTVANGDVYALAYPTAPSTWCTPTRCSSTWPTRWQRCGRWPGVCPGRDRRRTRRRLRGHDLVSRTIQGCDRWMQLYQQVARHNGGEPNAGRRLRRLGPGRRVRLGHRDRLGLVLRRPRTTWSGGRRRGPTGWSPRASASRPCSSGSAVADELADLAGAWRSWAAAPDAWFAILHGELICRPTSPADERQIRRNRNVR